MRRVWPVMLLAVAIAVAAAGAVYVLDRPTIPAEAAKLYIARTDVQSPDPSESPPSSGAYLVAQDCPRRVENRVAYADMCWAVFRQVDTDPEKDYYALHVGGTFGGENVRWFVLEARPLETTMLAGTDGLPLGAGGGCHGLPLSQPQQPGVVAGEQLCGRVVGAPGDVEGSWRVSWACEPCVLMDHADRGIDLELSVVVAEGTIPNWSTHLGFGS